MPAPVAPALVWSLVLGAAAPVGSPGDPPPPTLEPSVQRPTPSPPPGAEATEPAGADERGADEASPTDAADGGEAGDAGEPVVQTPGATTTAAPAPGPAPAPAPASAPPEAAPAPARTTGSAVTAAPRAVEKSRRRGKVEPRYHRAPIDDGVWSTLIDQDVLLVLSTGYRVCGTITAVTDETVTYEDPDSGARVAARYMVTAVHEASWECDTDSSIPKVEWAVAGSATGMTLAGAGLIFGVLQDAGVFNRPGSYAVLAFPTAIFGAPIVGIAGRSTARDLRVRGVPWARISGWVAFGGGALATALWSVGHLGDVEPLQFTGLASIGGGLSFAGAGLLGFDALRSRKEMLEVRRRDAEPAKTSALGDVRLGVTPLGGLAHGVHGVGVGISGRL